MFPLEKKTEQCFFLVFLLKLVQAGNSGKRRFLKKRVIFNRVAANLAISSFEFKLLFHLQIRHNSGDQRIDQLRYWTDEKIQKAFHLLSHSMWILLLRVDACDIGQTRKFRRCFTCRGWFSSVSSLLIGVSTYSSATNSDGLASCINK